MLPYRSHWHFAFERDPEREGRLVWFAATSPDPDGKVSDLTVGQLELVQLGIEQKKDEQQRLMKNLDSDIGLFGQKYVKVVTQDLKLPDATTAPDSDARLIDEFLNGLQPAIKSAYEEILLETDASGIKTPKPALLIEINKIRVKLRETLNAKIEEIKQRCQNFAKENHFPTAAQTLTAFLGQSGAPLQPEEDELIRKNWKTFIEAIRETKKELLIEEYKTFIKQGTYRTNDQAFAAFLPTKNKMEQQMMENAKAEFAQASKSTLAEQQAAESGNNNRKAKDIAKKLDELCTKMKEINQQRERADVVTFLKSLPPSEREKAEDAFSFFTTQEAILRELHDFSSCLAEWEEGQKTPQAFYSFLQRAYANVPALLLQINQGFSDAIHTHGIQNKVDDWNKGRSMNRSDKIMIVRLISDGIDETTRVREMNDIYSEWLKKVEKMETLLKEELERKQKRDEEQEKNEKLQQKEEGSGILERILNLRQQGLFGLTLHTPHEVISAVKKVWSAWNEAREEETEKIAVKIATGISGTLKSLYLPFGEGTDRRVVSVAEGNFNKTKNEYKEELGDDDFNTLLEKFRAVRLNPPKAVAVLEAAADHGWLYDLSDLSDEAWPVHIFGTNFSTVAPPHWDLVQQKNYIGTLTRKNTEGGGAEREKWRNRIKEQQDKEVYARKYKTLLESNNFWGAMGVGDALLDRGKMPEASEFLTVTLMHHLRNNETARKYATKSVLEQFGNTKWNEATTYSQNMVTMNMDTVKAYRRDGTMTGPLLGTMKLLEEDIARVNGSPMEEPALSRTMAEIMSGQTAMINGNAISIYDNKYREYWDESKQAIWGAYKADPFLKISTDYYVDASFLQLPSHAVALIFKTDSNGNLVSNEMALNYAGFAIKRLEELRNNNPRSADVFLEYMRAKLAPAVVAALAKKEQFLEFKWKQANKIGNPLLASLVSAGFLTREEVAAKVGDSTFMDKLEDQIQSL